MSFFELVSASGIEPETIDWVSAARVSSGSIDRSEDPARLLESRLSASGLRKAPLNVTVSRVKVRFIRIVQLNDASFDKEDEVYFRTHPHNPGEPGEPKSEVFRLIPESGAISVRPSKQRIDITRDVLRLQPKRAYYIRVMESDYPSLKGADDLIGELYIGGDHKPPLSNFDGEKYVFRGNGAIYEIWFQFS